MTQLHEDACRFIRQRLLALEESRDEDAAVLKSYIEEEFGCRIHDVDVQDVPLNIRERWHNYYGMPESVEKVTVLVTQAREPIWRIPYSLKDRGPSWFEVPLHMQQQNWLDLDDHSENPYEHLRPRQSPDALPEEVASALVLPEAT